MLNPFIIDQIRRREQQRREKEDKGFEQVQLELPKPGFYPAADEEEEQEEPERGVTIIDILG
jgi:hypothetical protein